MSQARVKIPPEVGGSLHVHDGETNAVLKIDEIPEDRIVQSDRLAEIILRDRQEHGPDHWPDYEVMR